jgi:hypothetical protein
MLLGKPTVHCGEMPTLAKVADRSRPRPGNELAIRERSFLTMEGEIERRRKTIPTFPFRAANPRRAVVLEEAF